MVDKSLTIKTASDDELNDLIVRLRREREVQTLIGDLKRAGTPAIDREYTDYSVSTETPITDLYHEDVDKVLAHYGILGMKWGVRRPRGKDGRVTGRGVPTEQALKKTKAAIKKPGAPPHQDHVKADSLKKRGYKALSNDELKALNNRLNLERNYRDLSSSDSLSGLDTVRTITAAGTTIAALYALTTTPLGKDVKRLFGKK